MSSDPLERYVEDDQDALLTLDTAYKAYQRELNDYEAEKKRVVTKLYQERGPIIHMAHALFFEAQAKCLRAGFTNEDMNRALGL